LTTAALGGILAKKSTFVSHSRHCWKFTNKKCLQAIEEVQVHKTLLKIIEDAVSQRNKKLLKEWKGRISTWEADPSSATECPYIPTHYCLSSLLLRPV
jgi:hypothetical protein